VPEIWEEERGHTDEKRTKRGNSRESEIGKQGGGGWEAIILFYPKEVGESRGQLAATGGKKRLPLAREEKGCGLRKGKKKEDIGLVRGEGTIPRYKKNKVERQTSQQQIYLHLPETTKEGEGISLTGGGDRRRKREVELLEKAKGE